MAGKLTPKLAKGLLLAFLCSIGTLADAQYLTGPMWSNHTPAFNFSAATQSIHDYDGAYGPWPAGMTAWSKRKKITILNATNPETETDFPVLVLLNSTRVNYADLLGAGQDLRFQDSSGNNLNYEIENWDTSGNSHIWVKIPSIPASSNTGYFWMYYGNPLAPAGQNPSGVWDANVVAYLHLNGTPGTPIADSTSIPHDVGPDGTASNSNGSGMQYQAGEINQGVYLDGVDDYIAIPHQASLDLSTAWTLSSWVYYSSSPGGNAAVVADSFGGGGLIQFCLGGCGTNKNQLGAGFYYFGWYLSPTFDVSANLNQWLHLAGVFNGANGTLSMYVNGALIGTSTGIPSWMPTSGGEKEIGRFGQWWDYLNGIVDEVSISNVARSDGWIQTQYYSSSDQLLSYGSTQTQSTGLITVSAALARTTAQAVTVPYTVTGTASNPADYVLANGNFSLPGNTLSSSFTFPFYRDPTLAVGKTVILTLGSPTHAKLGTTPVQTITLTAPGNRAPVPSTFNLTFPGGANPVTVDAIAGSSDPDGDPFFIQSVSASAHGTPSFARNVISYVPDGGFTGADSFTYTLVDLYGLTATGTANVNVTGLYCPIGTWTGLGGDHNWFTAANWCGNTVPTTTVTFDPALCTGANCNATVTGDPNVPGIIFKAGFTGTVTQPSGVTMTLGSTGWSQAGGTFVGGDSNISVGGAYTQTGGTFTSTSGELAVGGNFTVSSGTFNANGGLVNLWGTTVVITATVTFNGLKLSGDIANITLSGTLTVNGTLTLIDGHGQNYGVINGGIINANGDVAVNYWAGGTTAFNITGSGTQTISGTTGNLPPTTIASTGTVNFSGRVGVNGDFTYTSGTVNTGTSEVVFNYNLATITLGSFPFYDVTLNGEISHMTLVGTMTVNGTLKLADTHGGGYGDIFGGTINANGDVTMLAWAGASGTTPIRITGSGTQTITGNGQYLGFPKMVIASTGTVNLVSTIALEQDFTYTSGTVNAGTSEVRFNGTARTITPGSIPFYDVSFYGDSEINTLSGTLKVGHTLTYSDTHCAQCGRNLGGTVQASGDIDVEAWTWSGGDTSALTMDGAAQTITMVNPAFGPSGQVTYTGGGTVTQASAVDFSAPGQNLHITSGTWNMAGSALALKSLTLDPGTTLHHGGGTLTINGVTQGNCSGCFGGGTIN